jgi:hypothetical protein
MMDENEGRRGFRIPLGDTEEDRKPLVIVE